MTTVRRSKMSGEAYVGTLPCCDFCGAEAAYDARTMEGPWAYMCEKCWQEYGGGRLGTGYGQRLILAPPDETPNDRLLDRIGDLTGEDTEIARTLLEVEGEDLDGLQAALEDFGIL